MGACASSQHEHPPLQIPEVTRDDVALKCKVRCGIVIELQCGGIYSLADVFCTFSCVSSDRKGPASMRCYQLCP